MDVTQAQTLICFLLASFWFEPSAACNQQAVQAYCPHMDTVKGDLGLTLVTSSEQLDTLCDTAIPAIKCVLDDRFAKGCAPMQLVGYRSLWNVVQPMCTDWRKDMERSMKCFQTIEKAYSDANNQLKKIRSMGHICGHCEDFFYDAVQAAEDAGTACDDTAKWLLERKLYSYLRPYLELADCDWSSEYQYRTTPPTTTTTTTTTTTVPTTTEPEAVTGGEDMADLQGAVVERSRSRQKEHSDGNGTSSRLQIQNGLFPAMMVALLVFCLKGYL